jgi:serine/threonine protein kinase
MKLKIDIVGGPQVGGSFEIGAGETLVFGRGQQSDTKIEDPSISRIHCEIAHQGESIVIADRGSSSGTFVNGNKVENAVIQPGTTIQIGDTVLRVSESGAATMIGKSPLSETKPVSEMVGDKLGPYELTEIIGRGSSGVVFKALDSEKDLVAAVKVLSPQFTSNDEQRQRFVRAMKTMLPIRDPRIVRLHNAGKNGPYCWAAMEYIEGENLAELIKRIGIEDMLDWKKVWQVAVDIARALNTGHENKIIHRNVTPKNIIRRSSDGACLLGDFMLAKALEGTLAMDVTSPGQILGEVQYLAPERTLGSSEVDTRSDLYGLGATCYALLTGRPPISGTSITDMIKNVRDEVPEPPKKFQLSVNDLFQDVVMTLLEKEPAKRIESPAKLIKELLRIGKFNNLDAGF